MFLHLSQKNKGKNLEKLNNNEIINACFIFENLGECKRENIFKNKNHIEREKIKKRWNFVEPRRNRLV